MSSRAKENSIAALTLALGIVALYLHPADQYFFGDSISTLLTRSLTWGAAWRDMWRLSGTHWYRPIANGFMQFLLWPMWGLNFAPYHYLAMALHWGVSFGVYLFLRSYLGRAFPAWVAAAFYAWHPVGFYASYDVCFYQEPVGVGFTLLALAGFYWYVTRGSRAWLAAGVAGYALALLTREIAVMVAPLLVILVWPAIWTRRAVVTIGVTGAVAAAYTTVFLVVMHPQRYQPAGYASDWGASNLAANFWSALRWAFAIPAGVQTQGWQSPLLVRVILWGALVAGVAMVWRRASWKGLAWFAVSMIPALSTHNLLPHHLYLPLIGVALWIASLVETRAVGTALLACVVATSAIGARFDSVNSWVGHSSWETRLPVLYEKSVLRGMSGWRGVWVVCVDSDPSFSWIYGEMFRLMGNDGLETRLMKERPLTVPVGIHVFEYRNAMLTPLAIPASNVATPERVTLSVTPMEVRPGTSYVVHSAELAGRTIDLRYAYNEHLPQVAYAFARLDTAGDAVVPTPRETAWGWIDVLGVRPNGAVEWSPVTLRVVVLRD